MKLSKTKVRIELRRTIDNLKNCGFTFQQSLCIISMVNSISLLNTIEDISERNEILDTIIKEVYELNGDKNE